jgi:hypothetical protein
VCYYDSIKIEKLDRGETMYIKNITFGLIVVGLLGGCSTDIGDIADKYRANPKKGTLVEEIITEDIIPEIKKYGKTDLIAMEYANRCFTKASTPKEANICRVNIVKKFGNDYSFNKFKIWDKATKQKVLNFLSHNTSAVSCYMRADEAKDIIGCKDPIDPNF